MFSSGVVATGTALGEKAVLLDQSLVDQKAVIPAGMPLIVKFTPAVGLNEPNASYPIVIGGEESVVSGGDARLRVDGDAVVTIPLLPATNTFKPDVADRPPAVSSTT